MSNTTNINGLSSSLPYSPTPSNMPAQGFGFTANIANNLGYGIGRAIRGAFDSLWNTWQKMSTPAPCAEEIAQQRNYLIYQGGLKECVKQLGPALANLQMNPKDPGALKKVEQLSVHFARYLKPSYEENLRELQSKILNPLEERVSATAHLHLKKDLRKWMPVFFQGNNSINEKEQVERQSQVMQEFSVPFNSAFEMNCPQGADQSFYYPCQLANGVRSVCNYLDAGLSRLFSIFPAVSAKPVEPDKHKVTVFRRNNQHLAGAQVETAFIAYAASLYPPNPDGPGVIGVINTDNNKFVGRLTTVGYIMRMAITPNSSHVYMTDYPCRTVRVISTHNNKIVANVKVSGCFAIAITPDGQYAYVTNKDNSTISIIKTASNIVETNISIPFSPDDIAITPNGKFAYVTSQSGNSIIVIETTNNTVLTKIAAGECWGIAITPDGLYAYVANNDKTVSVISTNSNKVIATIQNLCNSSMNTPAIAITPNGLYAYVSCFKDKSVSVIRTINNTILTSIRVGNSPAGIAITSDGLYVYVANYDDNTISVINTTRNRAVNTIILGNSNNSQGILQTIAITPDKIPIPIRYPTANPTSVPTRFPTSAPTPIPTLVPTSLPTQAPTSVPTSLTVAPTFTNAPSHRPTITPTREPTSIPSETPTLTEAPSQTLTIAPTRESTAGGKTAFVVYMGCGKNFGLQNAVIAIDTGSNKVIANVSVGYDILSSIAITPNSLYVYMGNANVFEQRGTVSVIDTYSNRIVTNITVGYTFPRIAITPNGLYAYVTNFYNSTINLINMTSNAVTATLALEGIVGPAQIAITPNGLYAYVACFDRIGVIKTTNNAVLTTIDVGYRPVGIAISPNGLTAFVTGWEDKGDPISVINTTSNTVIAKLLWKDVAARAIAITPNGLYAYVTCSDNSVRVIETRNNTVLTKIDAGSSLREIAITPDGLYAYVVDMSSFIFVINTTSNAVITRINLDKGWSYGGIAITPTKIPIPTTEKDTGFIIGLSCGGGAFIILLGVGAYFTAMQLRKKEEGPSELNSLIDPLSTEQKMILI